MWCSLSKMLLIGLVSDLVAGAPRLSSVLESLHINSTDPTRTSFRWTFTRPHLRIAGAPTFINVLLDLEAKTEVFKVPVTDPLQEVNFFESKVKHAVYFRARSSPTELIDTKYEASFRNLTDASSIRVEVVQTNPYQYEISWSATDSRQINKLVIEHCSPECVRATLLQRDGSLMFTVPSIVNFTVTATFLRGDQNVDSSKQMSRPPGQRLDLKPPRKVTSIIEATHFENRVYIKWDAPSSPNRPITHYHLRIVNVDEEVAGTDYTITTTYLNTTVPPLRGPAFEVRMRAKYIEENMNGEKTVLLGDISEFRIPKYYPQPSPVKVYPLTDTNDGPRMIRWEDPEKPNGPIAGYVVSIRTAPLSSLQAFLRIFGYDFNEGKEHEFIVGPQNHSFPYDHEEVVNPHSYAVTAFTVDTEYGKRLFSERTFIIPRPLRTWRFTYTGLFVTNEASESSRLSRSLYGEELNRTLCSEELNRALYGEELNRTLYREELNRTLCHEELNRTLCYEELNRTLCGEGLNRTLYSKELHRTH
ncbi:uncharacterized protein LOC108863760 [Galendromus occidentalis]|uniref:Uncharacterized protein LOC108863760 n=1 Tax=Galendromus occidentalis TaxID=34638 RepID=A0AAJ7L2R1_9ACAR|nr:uncharacterized protein LOC108863760 [Galendromus occidentalis]